MFEAMGDAEPQSSPTWGSYLAERVRSHGSQVLQANYTTIIRWRPSSVFDVVPQTTRPSCSSSPTGPRLQSVNYHLHPNLLIPKLMEVVHSYKTDLKL